MFKLPIIFKKSSLDIETLENTASDVLELPNSLIAYRVDDEIIIIDKIKEKEVKRIKDTLPNNPARATLELIKRLNIKMNDEFIEEEKDIKKKASIWTCSFRENESRWVWYENSEPKITAALDNIYKNASLEDKIYFYSARFGNSVIEDIKEIGLEKTAKKIDALILENPFVKITCSNCSCKEHYTIDDLVDENKNAKYNSNFVICANCNKIIKLV